MADGVKVRIVQPQKEPLFEKVKSNRVLGVFAFRAARLKPFLTREFRQHVPEVIPN